MLNFGFFEIIVVVVLSLVVVGPERLPIVVRYLGRQYGKLMRASQELRRAFILEAERVDAEEKQQKLQKDKERRKREQQNKESSVQKSMEKGEVQPLEAGIGTMSLDTSITKTDDEPIPNGTSELDATISKEQSNDDVNTTENQVHNEHVKAQLQQNPFVQTEELNDDPLFPRSKQDFS